MADIATMPFIVGQDFDNAGRFIEAFLVNGLVSITMDKGRGVRYVVTTPFAVGWETKEGTNGTKGTKDRDDSES